MNVLTLRVNDFVQEAPWFVERYRKLEEQFVVRIAAVFSGRAQDSARSKSPENTTDQEKSSGQTHHSFLIPAAGMGGFMAAGIFALAALVASGLAQFSREDHLFILFVRNKNLPVQIKVVQDLLQKTLSNIFTFVKWDERGSAIGMPEENVTSLLSDGFKAKIFEDFDYNRWRKRSESHRVISTSWRPTNFRGVMSPSTSRYREIASLILSSRVEIVLACVWQPGSEGTEATYIPSSSLSIITGNSYRFLDMIHLLRYLTLTSLRIDVKEESLQSRVFVDLSLFTFSWELSLLGMILLTTGLGLAAVNPEDESAAQQPLVNPPTIKEAYGIELTDDGPRVFSFGGLVFVIHRQEEKTGYRFADIHWKVEDHRLGFVSFFRTQESLVLKVFHLERDFTGYISEDPQSTAFYEPFYHRNLARDYRA
jgi:hypothetical protein